jgi:hypothetical protein
MTGWDIPMEEQNDAHNLPHMWGKLKWLEPEYMERAIPRIRRDGFPLPVEPDTSIDDTLAILWHEFMAEPGSFLLTLRLELRWDKVAFDRMTEAMRKCCQFFEERLGAEDYRLQSVLGKVPRWLASGYMISHSGSSRDNARGKMKNKAGNRRLRRFKWSPKTSQQRSGDTVPRIRTYSRTCGCRNKCCAV